MFNNTTMRLVFVYAMPAEAKEQAKSDITALLRDGLLAPVVAESFPLEETAAAHELIESGKALGNVICRP
jgi:NADPH2:quinone reductase